MKWGKKFWKDTAERCVGTAGATAIAMLTATGSDVVSSDPKAWWTLVGLPTVVTALKAVVMNATTGTNTAPSASLVDVSSNSA